MSAEKHVHVADAPPPDQVFRTELAGEWLESPAPKRDAAPPLALWGVFPDLPPVARFEPVLALPRPQKGRGAGERAWR